MDRADGRSGSSCDGRNVGRKINLSQLFARQNVGIKEVADWAS